MILHISPWVSIFRLPSQCNWRSNLSHLKGFTQKDFLLKFFSHHGLSSYAVLKWLESVLFLSLWWRYCLCWGWQSPSFQPTHGLSSFAQTSPPPWTLPPEECLFSLSNPFHLSPWLTSDTLLLLIGLGISYNGIVYHYNFKCTLHLSIWPDGNFLVRTAYTSSLNPSQHWSASLFPL